MEPAVRAATGDRSKGSCLLLGQRDRTSPQSTREEQPEASERAISNLHALICKEAGETAKGSEVAFLFVS